MAGFVESATLRVLDQSSGPVKKINTALDKLFQTASKLRSIKVDIRINAPRDLNRTIGQLDRLHTSLSRLSGSGLSGLSGAASQINALARALNTPISTRGLTNALSRINAANFGNLGNATAQIRGLAGAIHSLNNATAGMRGGRLNMPNVPPQLPPGGYGRGGRQPVDNGWLGRYPENIPGIAARYAAYRTVGYVHDAGRGAWTGMTDASTQRVMMGLRNFTPEMQTAIEAATSDSAGRFPILTRANFSDVFQQLGFQFEKPQDVTGSASTVGRMAGGLALLYGDSRRGSDGARDVIRLLDSMGLAENAGSMNKYMDVMLPAIMAAGRDFNTNQFATVVRNMGLTKGALSTQGMVDLISLTDENRFRASQLMRMGIGDVIRPNLNKEGKALMAEVGLRDANGRVNKDVAREVAATPVDFAIKRLLPLIQKKGIDPEDVTAVADWLTNDAGFTRSGADLFANILKKKDEIMRFRRRVQQVKSGELDIREGMSGSLEASTKMVGAKFQDLADAYTKSLVQPVIKGILGGTAGALQWMENKPGLAAIALTAGTAGAWAVNNPGHVALGVAAFKLGGAAGLLSLAARGLMAAGVAGRAGALAPLAGLAAAGAAGSRVAGLAGAMGGTAAGAAGGAASAGMLARLMARWGRLGGWGKFGVAGGAIGGIGSLLTGDWLGAAGGAMTVGGLLMGGPIGATIAALGALASVWPMLRDFLFGTAANASEVESLARGLNVPRVPGSPAPKLNRFREETNHYLDTVVKALWDFQKGVEKYMPEMTNLRRYWDTGLIYPSDQDAENAAGLHDPGREDRGLPPGSVALRRRAEQRRWERAIDWWRESRSPGQVGSGLMFPSDQDAEWADQSGSRLRVQPPAQWDALWQRMQGWGFDKPPSGGGIMEWLRGLNPFQTGSADMRSMFEGAGEPIRVAGQDASRSISESAPSITSAGQAASEGWYNAIVSAGREAGASIANAISSARVDVNVNPPSQTGRGSVGAAGVTNV